MRVSAVLYLVYQMEDELRRGVRWEGFLEIEEIAEKTFFLFMAMPVVVVAMSAMSAVAVVTVGVLPVPGIFLALMRRLRGRATRAIQYFIQLSAIQPNSPTLRAKVYFHSLTFADGQIDFFAYRAFHFLISW